MERTKFENPHRDLMKAVLSNEALVFFGIKERDAKLFSKYMTDQLTMGDVAEDFDLSYERVRQIIQKCLRKIRHSFPQVNKYEDYGTMKRKIKNKDDELARLRNVMGNNAVPVEKLNIYVRTYNAIVYSLEVKTVGELVDYTEQDLLKLRNFGKKSLMDLNQALKEYGVRLKSV